MESLHEVSQSWSEEQSWHGTCGGGAGAGTDGGGAGGCGAGPRDGQRPEEGRTSMARTAATAAALRARPDEPEAIGKEDTGWNVKIDLCGLDAN
jgi:hypothetical protein